MSEPVCIEPGCVTPATTERPTVMGEGGDRVVVVELVCQDHTETVGGGK